MPDAKTSTAKPNRLDVWGDSMTNGLPSLSRQRRKRETCKKRRKLFKCDDQSARTDYG